MRKTQVIKILIEQIKLLYISCPRRGSNFGPLSCKVNMLIITLEKLALYSGIKIKLSKLRVITYNGSIFPNLIRTYTTTIENLSIHNIQLLENFSKD